MEVLSWIMLAFLRFKKPVERDPCSPENLRDFRALTLSVFNQYREEHELSTCKHNWDLTNAAQKWADELAKTGEFETSNQHINGKFANELIGRQFEEDYTIRSLIWSWKKVKDTNATLIKPGYSIFGIGKAVGCIKGQRTYTVVAFMQ